MSTSWNHGLALISINVIIQHYVSSYLHTSSRGVKYCITRVYSSLSKEFCCIVWNNELSEKGILQTRDIATIVMDYSVQQAGTKV
jgi:hypothetical protein